MGRLCFSCKINSGHPTSGRKKTQEWKCCETQKLIKCLLNAVSLLSLDLNDNYLRLIVAGQGVLLVTVQVHVHILYIAVTCNFLL